MYKKIVKTNVCVTFIYNIKTYFYKIEFYYNNKKYV